MGSDSFSETSSIGQAEEATSLHPHTSPSVPEEDSHVTCDVTPVEMEESGVQELTQGEAEETSDDRNPEGQEVEQSGG